MQLELPEELRLMRGTLRRFIDNEVIPYERESWNGSDLKPEGHLDVTVFSLV